MKNLSKLHNILLMSMSIFACLFIITATVFYAQNYLLETDDTDLFLNESFFQRYFINVYKAKYIGSFLSKFIACDLPKMFSIHPNIWIQSYGAVIKGIFYCILSFSLSSCLFLFHKKNFFFPIFAIISYLFIILNLYDHLQGECWIAFFCFTFQVFFFILFWKNFIPAYVNNENYKKLYLFAFLLGISSEATAIISLFSISFIILFEIINKRFKFKSPVTLSFLFFVFGIFLYFINPEFINNVKQRGTLDGHTVQNAVSSLPEFIQGYLHTFIHDFSPYFIIIAILAILIYFFSNIPFKNKLIPVFIIFPISGLIFFSFLLFAGRGASGSTFVTHFDLIFQLQLMLLSVIAFELSCFYKKEKTLSYFLTLAVIIICFLFKNPLLDSVYKIIQLKKSTNINERYLDERIIAYYSFSNSDELISSAKSEAYMSPTYFNYMYGLQKFNPYDFKITFVKSSNEAYNIYLQKGGCEIPESDIKKADFNQLLNKNYVLTCK